MFCGACWAAFFSNLLVIEIQGHMIRNYRCVRMYLTSELLPYRWLAIGRTLHGFRLIIGNLSIATRIKLWLWHLFFRFALSWCRGRWRRCISSLWWPATFWSCFCSRTIANQLHPLRRLWMNANLAFVLCREVCLLTTIQIFCTACVRILPSSDFHSASFITHSVPSPFFEVHSISNQTPSTPFKMKVESTAHWDNFTQVLTILTCAWAS